MTDHEISVTYTNYRFETRRRVIRPEDIHWGSTEWHPEPGWLMVAYDVEKDEMREFALADCDFATDTAALRAEIQRLREALGEWQSWWELPWQAKRPDVAQRVYDRACNAMSEGTDRALAQNATQEQKT